MVFLYLLPDFEVPDQCCLQLGRWLQDHLLGVEVVLHLLGIDVLLQFVATLRQKVGVLEFQQVEGLHQMVVACRYQFEIKPIGTFLPKKPFADLLRPLPLFLVRSGQVGFEGSLFEQQLGHFEDTPARPHFQVL